MLFPPTTHPLSGSWPWSHTGIATASPTTSTLSGCMSKCPLSNLAHGGVPCAPGPPQGVANRATAPSCHWISKVSINTSSSLYSGSLPGLFIQICKGARWETKLWDRGNQGHICWFPSPPCMVKWAALWYPCTLFYPKSPLTVSMEKAWR